MKKVRFAVILTIALLFSNMNVFAASVAELMSVAFQPVGKCLYVYGGGWNEADTAAGAEAMSYGISDRWVEFYNQNPSSYNYKNTRYQIHNGLDCTGYVGWCMYQIFGDKYSSNGYVYLAEVMAKKYSEIFSGAFIPKSQITNYQCGDIMSSGGHAYMVLGQCGDGSVVFLHASPPNVSLCGTYTPNGNSDSEAIKLAKTYMQEFFPEPYQKFGNYSRGTDYLRSYHQMRWTSEVLPDSDGYRGMSAEQILEDIFKTLKVYINGERLHMPANPEYNGNSIYVPIRSIAESLGAEVKWVDSQRKAVLAKDDKAVEIFVDDNKIITDGRDVSEMEVYLKYDLTYVPVRLISESLGANVDWDNSRGAVKITY